MDEGSWLPNSFWRTKEPPLAFSGSVRVEPPDFWVKLEAQRRPQSSIMMKGFGAARLRFRVSGENVCYVAAMLHFFHFNRSCGLAT